MARATVEPQRARAQSARERAHAQQSRDAAMDELADAFRHLWRSLGSLRGRDTHLGEGELSHAQFELLFALRERGELSLGELAAAARIAPGSVSQMLDHLALSGHVERARSSHDRRVVTARLTRQGRARIEAKHATWQERWENALEGVEPRELRAAAAVLARLGEMVESASPATRCEQPQTRSASTPASAMNGGNPLL